MFSYLGPESLLIALALLVSLTYPEIASSYFTRVESVIGSLARRKTLSVIFCGVVALAIRVALLPIIPIPHPQVHDEFSFLLAADTFAHGRIANPPHVMAKHFETFHVLFHPTYASMYPPLQGMVMAAGKVIAGHPCWGVWLSVGLMSATLCWMLQGWFPPGWALFGALIGVTRFGVLSYWDNSYWGGALAATGGALILGAFPRIRRKLRARDAIAFAIGVAVLANTRPYEGLVLSSAVAVAIGIWFRRVWQLGARNVTKQFLIPALLVLMVAGIATGYYCWRVTGNPLCLPQQLNRSTYAVAKYFYWQSPNQFPSYSNAVMRNFYTGPELAEYQSARSLGGFVRQSTIKVASLWTFFIGPSLTFPLFAMPWILRDKRVKPLLVIGAACVGATALVIFYFPHYSAPIAALILAVIVQGMRHLRQWCFEGRQSGLFLLRAIVIVLVVTFAIQVRNVHDASQSDTFGRARFEISTSLRGMQEGQLVLVHYRPNHNSLQEWVYNGADIDGEKVIWARDLGADQNTELIQHYQQRQVWRLDADEIPPRLTPYSEQNGAEWESK